LYYLPFTIYFCKDTKKTESEEQIFEADDDFFHNYACLLKKYVAFALPCHAGLPFNPRQRRLFSLFLGQQLPRGDL